MHPQLVATMRQILAVLECERQALAALDLEAILGCAAEKSELCTRAEGIASAAAHSPPLLCEESRALLEAARRRNAVNRQIRNLLAANVAARMDSLTGAPALYAASPAAAAAAFHARG